MANIIQPFFYNDGYIGFEKSETTNFFNEDSEELFNHNLSTKPMDWRYRDSLDKISYQFNSTGHRNDFDLTEIHDKEYIIVAGCSLTMGIGVSNEETYAGYLSKLSNLPVYNLGLAASSNQVSMFNLSWVLGNYNPPSAIVLQKTDVFRFPIKTQYKVDDDIPLIFAGSWISSSDESFEELDVYSAISDKFNISEFAYEMSVRSITAIANKLNIKVVTYEPFIEDVPFAQNYHYARDDRHLGSEHNLDIAKKLWNKINN